MSGKATRIELQRWRTPQQAMGWRIAMLVPGFLLVIVGVLHRRRTPAPGIPAAGQYHPSDGRWSGNRLIRRRGH